MVAIELAIIDSRELQRRLASNLRRIKAGAALLAGWVALSLGDTSGHILVGSPRRVAQTFITLLMITGFLLARAFIAVNNAIEYAEDVPEREQVDLSKSLRQLRGERDNRNGSDKNISLIKATIEYRVGHLFFQLCLLFGIVAAAVFMIATWWKGGALP